MKFERQTIYKKYNTTNDISYILVLDVQKYGMVFMYFTNERDNTYYNSIDGLYFSDIDRCVSINRPIYCDWSKIHSKYYEKYRAISIREMRKITTSMKDLYDGIITYDKNGHLCYTDEINQENFSSDSDNIITPKEKEDITITCNNDALEKHTDTVSVDTSTADDNTKIIVDDVIEEGIDDTAISSESNQLNHTNTGLVKYVDLLKPSVLTDAQFKNSKRTQNKSKKNTSNRKRWFTEDEALAITCMRNSVIASKYNVPASTAGIMKKNAYEYFGFEYKSERGSINQSGYTKFFNDGLNVDQVCEKIPSVDRRQVAKSYERWCSNNSKKRDDFDDRLKNIIERRDINELLSISNMSHNKIIIEFGCSNSFAEKIAHIVRNILSENIFFTVFGDMAYDENFVKYIESCKRSNTNKKFVESFNYDTCVRLKDVYNATYDKHYDILAGIENIPTEVQGDDKRRFLNIIRRRFNKKVPVADMDKKMIDIINNNDTIEYATIMMTTISAAKSFMWAYHHKSNISK